MGGWLWQNCVVSPEVYEDEDGNEKGNDGDSVSQEEDEYLQPSLHLQRMIQRMVKAFCIVGIVLPCTITVAELADIVYNYNILGTV